MSNLSGYPTRSFKESQKFLVQDPSTGTASLVLGSDLVDYITPRLNSVIAETTRVAAENTDYDIGKVIQTTGATSPGDDFAAVYLVVEGGTGDFPMINGNDLLVIRGDEFLREQLAEDPDVDGNGVLLVNGGMIYRNSIADIESLAATDGLQVSLSGLQSGIFKFDASNLSAEVSNDPQKIAYVPPSSDPTGSSGAWVRQFSKDINADWASLLGDGSDEASKINDLLSTASFLGVGIKGDKAKTYRFGSQLTIQDDMRLDGINLERLSTYTTDEPAMLGVLGTSSMELVGCRFIDSTAGGTNSFVETTGGENLTVKDCYFSNAVRGIEFSGANNVKISHCVFFETNYGLDTNGCTSVIADRNYFYNMGFSAAVMSATSGQTAEMQAFNNNIVDITGDTAVFMRCFDSSTTRALQANGNIFHKLGKAGVKFTVPAGNNNASINSVMANNNIVRGWAFNVISNCFGARTDASDTGNTINNVSFIGNNISGKDNDDNLPSVAAISNIGIRIALASAGAVTVSGNSISDTSGAGIEINNTEGACVTGNTLSNCCQPSGGYSIYLFGANRTLVDCNVTGCPAGSGLRMVRSRNCVIRGEYSDNFDYGIWEETGGDSTQRCRYNQFSFNNTGNGTLPIFYETVSLSREENSFDDDGSREFGTETRRDAIDFGSFANNGKTFFNTTTELPNFRLPDGTWILADGTPA